MAFTIDQHHVLKYAEDVDMAYQQETSRIRPYVNIKSGIVGKSFSVNGIGVVEAATKDARHEMHSHQNPEHETRWGNLVYKYVSILMDPDDDDRVLADPRNRYVMDSASALGRDMESTIITAALGTATTGEDRSGSQALPTAQKVTGSTSGFTLTKFRQGKRILDAAEVPGSDRVLVISAQGLEDLLADTTITSIDFNGEKPLVTGRVTQFLGFTILMTELLPIGSVAANVRQGLMMHKRAVTLGISRDKTARIALRRDMHDAWESYCAHDIGAVRQWDEGVVEIHYLET